jgi:hypothetical protein
VIVAVPLGIGVGVEDVVVVVAVVDVVEVGEEGVDVGDASDVRAASGSEEPEQLAVTSAAAKATDRSALTWARRITAGR